MLDKERNILEYRPEIRYIPQFAYNAETYTDYEFSPVLKRLTEKVPSGVLGEILSNKEDAEVILKRVEKCVGNNKQVEDYLSDKELAKKMNFLPETSCQLEAIPFLKDAIAEYDKIIELAQKVLFNGKDIERIGDREQEDKAYIEKLAVEEITGEVSRQEQLDAETKVINTECISRMAENTTNFVKGLTGVLYGTVNEVYNGNIADVVNTYGEAPQNVLAALKTTNTVKFKKACMEHENNKARYHRLDSSGIKSGTACNFDIVSKLRNCRVNDIYEWINTINTDMDRSPVTVIVEDALDDIEFINEEFERTKLEYFKQIELDKVVKNDIVASLKNKKAAKQKLRLISDIISEKESNSFNPDTFMKDRKLLLKGTLCTQ